MAQPTEKFSEFFEVVLPIMRESATRKIFCNRMIHKRDMNFVKKSNDVIVKFLEFCNERSLGKINEAIKDSACQRTRNLNCSK